MKRLAKIIVVSVLGWQVRRLTSKHSFKTIAVVGSIGKTSTKSAIATMLGNKYRVMYQNGNYNDLVSVPLVYFGQDIPPILNIVKWLALLLKNERKLRQPYPFDFVVLELGTDAPGQIEQFGRFVDADLAVVTALTQEHMENFNDIRDVAQEELSVASFSKVVLVNSQLCPKNLLGDVKYKLYGEDVGSEYWLYSVQAAEAVAAHFGMSKQEIKNGKKQIKPMLGRMNRLDGIKESIIIDDTYNSSPDAAIAALGVLRGSNSPQKIAILGSMNELGAVSAESHSQVGKVCQPSWLDCVVTIGEEANRYIAPVAKENGCKVFEFTNPKLAGKYVRSVVESGAVVLAKGSQNGVFAEEAVKELLADSKDVSKLVRQSKSWMSKKNRQFEGLSTKYAE